MGDDEFPSVADDEEDTQRPSWQSDRYMEAQREHQEAKKRKAAYRNDNPFAN